ncbi:MAG: FGGY family carbohydrate kinase, partial [Bulleidia sp.]
MSYLGIDIGTSTICFISADESGHVLKQITLPNNAGISSTRKTEYLQNPDVIVSVVISTIEEISRQCQIDGIGVTGQMHGILYVDENGNACSSLYTWEDQRGNEFCQENLTYADLIREKTDYPVPTGYGSM